MRIELDAAADATGLVGGAQGRARAKERVDDDVAAVGEIEKGVLAYMLKLRGAGYLHPRCKGQVRRAFSATQRGSTRPPVSTQA